MKAYIVLDSSGQTVRRGRCPDIDFANQAGPGETVIEDTATQPAPADPAPDLPTLKRALQSQVDAVIEQRRQAAVTPGTVMQLVYGMKKLEAYVFATLPAPPDPPTAAAAFPLLAKEAEYRGISLAAMVDQVNAANETFRTAMGDLEILRYQAKAAIEVAGTEVEARTALNALLGAS